MLTVPLLLRTNAELRSRKGDCQATNVSSFSFDFLKVRVYDSLSPFDHDIVIDRHFGEGPRWLQTYRPGDAGQERHAAYR